MKKVIGMLAAFSLILSLFAAGCRSEKAQAEADYYKQYVLDHMNDDFQADPVLTGISEGICLIEDPEAYDASYVNAASALLLNEDAQEIVYAKAPYERIYPASMTKCMTALLTLEHCTDLEELVKVGPEVTEGLDDNSSLAGLKEGASYSVKDLLAALLVPSGNDAANVLACYVAGSIPAFVELMNEKASELCMLNTHFMNPHGLHDKQHYTTVYDLYLLTRACIEYPVFVNTAGTEKADVSCVMADGSIVQETYVSTNSFLKGYTLPPAGITIQCAKTGYTAKAGRCLILVTKNEREETCISIMAHAETYDDLYIETNKLLDLLVRE